MKPYPLYTLLQEEKGVFMVEEIMPWNTSLQLWKNIFHWHTNPWIYWIDQCTHFYSNRSDKVKV